MTSYYNPSKRLSEWAAAALSPFIQLETEDGQTDHSRLSVGIWSGHIQLKNVELRPEAFDKFLNSAEVDYNEHGTKIRWKIVRGTIDNVSVGIPWKSLLMGTSYSSSRRRGGQKPVVDEQSELKRSVQRHDSDVGEVVSCAGQDNDQTTNRPPADDDQALSGCTTIKINGLCLILGYDVIHQDSSLDPSHHGQSFHGDTQSEEQSNKELRDEKNRILQIAERRLLARLDPFPPSLTMSLQEDIKSVLQSSLEQSMSNLPPEDASVTDPSSTSTPTYRSKVENYLSSTIKSILWRTYDSLSISVTHVKMSMVGISHYDKKIRVLGKKRNKPIQIPETKPSTPKHRHRLRDFKKLKRESRLEFGSRFISTDVWDMNWEPYPGIIHTPAKKQNKLVLEERSDEVDSDYDSEDVDAVPPAAEEDDVAIWSREGHVEIGFVLDKLDARPGLVPQLSPKQEPEKEQNDENDSVPMSVKHFNFCRMGVFVRRGTFNELTARRAAEQKPKRGIREKKPPWHELDHDDFVVIPTNIETECKFYRYPVGIGDVTTVTSTRTTKESKRLLNNKSMNCEKSHATTETKRRGKRDKGQPQLNPSDPKSTIQSIESNFTESYLIPKQLELNWTVGHIRSSLSSRHLYLISSCIQSLSRLKKGRPATTIRSAKAHDRKLIERMTEEGQPVITALDARMYRVLPQLRSTKYSRRTLLALPRVVSSWWRWAIMSVIIELKDRQDLIDKCTSINERRQSNNVLTTAQKLSWDWNEQSRIRQEYIELYLLVNGPSDEENASRSTKVSVLAAESRMEEIESSLHVERILLLRKVSRAALMAKERQVSFYNFAPNERYSHDFSCAAEVDAFEPSERNPTISEAAAKDQNTATTTAAALPTSKKSIVSDGKDRGPLFLCSSVSIAGVSVALCELHVSRKQTESRSDTKEDDDISALTGFSDVSVDSSSLHQSSEQQTVYDRFDSSLRFWEHDKRKLRHKPVSILHISDISLSVQCSSVKRKYRVLVGGVVLGQKDAPNPPIFSIGHVSGLEKSDAPVTIPCMSMLTVCGKTPSIVFNLKPAMVTLDLARIQRISTFLITNQETCCRGNLTPLYKEQDLKRVVSNVLPTSKMSLTIEWESLQVVTRLGQNCEEAKSISLSLKALRYTTEQEHDGGSSRKRVEGGDKGCEMIIDEVSIQIQREEYRTNHELFIIPIKLRVNSSMTGSQPIAVTSSPIHLLISEIRVKAISEFINQFSLFFNGTVGGNVEYLKPRLPTIAEYALREVQLTIETFGVHIFEDAKKDESTTPPPEKLREITHNFISLISCLDVQHPNQDAIDCMCELFEYRCINLGLSKEEARQLIDSAILNYQSNIKSELGESSATVERLYNPEEIMDRIVSQATDATISASNVQTFSSEVGLFLFIDALSLSLSSFYCKTMVQVKSKQLKVHDGAGINLLHIMKVEEGVALDVSLSSYGLHSDEFRREIYFEVETANLTAHPEACMRAITTFQSVVDAALMGSNITNLSGPSSCPVKAAVNGTLASVALITMDDFIPFVRLIASGLSFDHSSVNEGSSSSLLGANDISLHCVSPSGADTYPDVIKTHPVYDQYGYKEHYALTIHIKKQNDVQGSNLHDVSMCFDGVRVTVLRQFINEVTQYLLSPKYGLGLLKSKAMQERTQDAPPANHTQFTVNIVDSTLILPRDSNSVDLVGIEVDELTISPLNVKESWDIDSYSFERDFMSSARSSTSEMFFDCTDDESAPIQLSQIPRIAVTLQGARLFTALDTKQHSPCKIKMPFWNRFVSSSGRCEDGKPVYKAKMKNPTNPLTAETLRVWQEVTREALSIDIKADLAPTLRLLIEMKGNSFLDIRMSQLYLMMSIWYANMQELPVLYPYDDGFVQETSTPLDMPEDWPEYGSEDFVKRLIDRSAEKTFVLALCINNLSLDCSYDTRSYFMKDPSTLSMLGSDVISLSLEHVLCSVVSDSSSVLRLAIGATAMAICDGSAKTPYEQLVSVKNVSNVSSFVDLDWGLDSGRHTLVDGLPLPFQATVFMSPDNHCMINLGADYLEGTIENLSAIWVLLDYFGLYFKDPAFGHPCFLADQIVQEELNSAPLDHVGLDIDFRLWLTRPHLVIPSSSSNHSGVCIMLEAESGIYYRYKSYGLSYSSQDIVAKDLGVVALREHLEFYTQRGKKHCSRGRRQVSGCLQNSGAQTLIDGLSFSIQYDFNEATNYTKLVACIPLSDAHLDRNKMNGIEPGNIGIQPYQCKAPIVCKPFFMPPRNMGIKFTAHINVEYMKLALQVLTAFVGPKQDAEISEVQTPTQMNLFSITACVEGAEIILSDPLMGMHRPILSFSFPSLLLSASQLEVDEHIANKRMSYILGDSSTVLSECNCPEPELQISAQVTAFVDYFKLGATRNWEPLIEPFQSLILYEKSQIRGQGVTINFDCPLHLNITSAAIDTFDDAKETFELFQSSERSVNHAEQTAPVLSTSGPVIDGANVLHSRAEHINESERRAFAFKNNTGQQIRMHTLGPTTTLQYVDHLQTMPLSFPATITSIRNFQCYEVSVEDRDQTTTTTSLNNHNIAHHVIDIQVPGFHWLRGVSMEETGRKFLQLIPRCPELQSKIGNDWRLSNGVQILADVRSLNGGRRLTLHSPFEIINKTDHALLLSFSPDPRDFPQEHSVTAEEVNPEESCTVPHLLLERALRLTGAHLGSIWIKPKPNDNSLHPKVVGDYVANDSRPNIIYPSRPIQLAKIVHETSVIWNNSKADPTVANQFASGTEISCPILDANDSAQTIPFCYVVEVKRSPLASQKMEESDLIPQEVFSPSNITRGLKSVKNKPNKAAGTVLRHQPVLYSLVVHPPIVIENLLPETGRFELMHAVTENVLWWGFLKPGEKLPVHEIGLDAPITLLVNLGHCRTPVGEGALVHNGRVSGGLFKAGWNTLGNAMKTSRDRVKRTLYSVTESRDNRGAGRITDMQRGMNKANDASRKIGQLGFNNENEITANDELIWYGEGFDAEIDSELTVIDSIGQRLILHIDNVIGGGGQRFISLFCPYWIVNTTSHSLRYKQEKISGFVSGTVLSQELDGSKRVDSSNRNDEDKHGHDLPSLENEGPYSTIFSGKPGALHTPDGAALEPAALACLISEDLPLSIMSDLAFMFNFQETISLGTPMRLCVQLADGTGGGSHYRSAWSSGFGLESVGVTQIVGMHCKDGRRLEVSISVALAPGRLSNYTKIVRICPRYVIVNQLSRTIRLWQDNSMLHPNKPVDHSLQVDESNKWILSNGISSLEDGHNEYKSLFGEKITIGGSLVDTTAHPDACYITTVPSSELVAFHLPDTRIDRLLRIDCGGAWNLSSSIPADVTGEYHLNMTRAVDLRLLPQVSTRAAPVYTVTIPSPGKEWNGELGAYFETDWGRERTLIVKGVKENTYAKFWTDINVGDELISIDDMAVHEFEFEEAMKLLKSRLSSVKDHSSTNQLSRPFRKTRTNDNLSEPIDSVVLTFMTFEERMRSLRRKAVLGRIARGSTDSRRNISNNKPEDIVHRSKDVLINTKFLFQTIFMFVQEPRNSDPPHVIRNRSLKWAIFYRQRNCEGHPWSCLYPGESASYTWQEPTRPKKLSVKVGHCDWNLCDTTRANERKPYLYSFNFIKDEEQGYYGPTQTIRLEEIGHVDSLPVPASTNRSDDRCDESIHCIVDTEGTTRALIVSDEMKGSYQDDEILIKRHLTKIRKDIATENSRRMKLDALSSILSIQGDPSTDSVTDLPPARDCDVDRCSVHNLNFIESELQDLIDFGEGHHIVKRHQLLVQVLEANGLLSADLNGLSNPYVKISLKHHASAFRGVESRCTYYVEKSLSPTWSQQIFVFDVPAKAARDRKETRNISLQCTVKSLEKLGKDRFLGQIQIQLRDLINQKEVVGWYPLMGVIGQRDVDSVDRIRGSIKMRVQYVSDYQGLIAYNQLCSERRIKSLKKTKVGMQRQLRILRETARQQAESRESISLKATPSLTSMSKRKKRAAYRPKQKLELVEEGLMQSSKLMKGVREGTEQTLKKSMNLIARSVVRKKRRSSTSSAARVLVDQDDRARCETDDTFVDEDLLPDDILCDSRDFDYEGSISLVPHKTVKSEKVSATTRALDLQLNYTCISRLRGNSPKQYFSTWNMARAFYSHQVQKNPQNGLCITVDSSETSHNDQNIILKLPPSVPSAVKDREINYSKALMLSRQSFSKKARCSLKNIVNPGGVLTIRPITALNLSNDYLGMFVKLRYGSSILVSETVDCRVAPVWTRDENNFCEADFAPQVASRTKRRHSIIKSKKNVETGPTEFADLAEMVNPLARWGRPRKNDLHIEVAPFETSKSLRLSVIGERIQSNVEIGVLEIELRGALECCTQSLEEFNEDNVSENPQGLPPAYVRWFPLTSPTEAIQVEGDMGLSAKPKESEKPRDDMFKEYFQPCIKLALMFKPHSDDTDDDDTESYQISRRPYRSSTDRYLYAKLDSISAALIDSNRISVGELVSFTFRDTDLRISVTKAKTRIGLGLGTIQIDQQRQRTVQDSKAPVILSPTPVKSPQPVVQFLVWKDNTRCKPDLDSFDYVALEVQNLDLKIEEAWLFDMWEFYVAIAKSRERKGLGIEPLQKNESAQFSTGAEEHTNKAMSFANAFLQSTGVATSSKKVYIRELILGYFQVSLWYYKRSTWSGINDELSHYELFISPRLLSQRMSDKGASDEAFKQWSENIALGDSDALSPSTINLVSAIIPSISDASISFQGKLIEHVFESQGDVWKSLRSHYSSEALKQIYKIIGSLDFVGNPSMMLTSFRTGLKDFILQPSRELRHLTKNPTRVGVGVLKGTVSLFSNSTSGIFGFFSNLGSTAGQTASMFTFDEHFQRHHSEKQTAQQRHYERWKRKGCGHVTLMFTRPIHDIVFGVISASTGVLTEPYRGAKRNGVLGFGKGVGVGIIGLVVKPVVGFCDAFAHFMGSIDDIARSVNLLDVKFKPVERYRLPYTFGAGRMLLPFNQVQSRSAQLLSMYPIDKKTRMNDEVIVSSQALHIGPGCDHYIIVTTRRIVCFKLRDLDGTGFITVTLEWQVQFVKGFRVFSSIGTKGYSRVVLHISSTSERIVDDSSSSGSIDNDNFFQMESKYDGSSINMERSLSLPETPKTFRMRNTLFANTDVEPAQRFMIEGTLSQKRQLVCIHNAVCCLTGDVNNLIREGRCINGNEGITSFGNLTFDLDVIKTEKGPHDHERIRSALERAPWLHLQDIGAWSTEIFEQVVSSDTFVVECEDETSDLMTFTPIEPELETVTSAPDHAMGSLNHFTFADYSSDESLRESSIIGVSQADSVGVDDQIDWNLHGDTLVATIGSHSDQPDGSDTVGPENNSELPTQCITAETITRHPSLDSRLQRVEELLEQLVVNNQSHDSEPHEALTSKHYTGETISPIQETEEENNDNNGVTSEVEVLRHEISELKRQMAEQADVNMLLRQQIEANKKPKLKLFRKPRS